MNLETECTQFVILINVPCKIRPLQKCLMRVILVHIVTCILYTVTKFIPCLRTPYEQFYAEHVMPHLEGQDPS